MKDSSIRIADITIRNLKNVSYGEIDVSRQKNVSYEKSDVIGVYGQNGSGKTAVIDALWFVKSLMCGVSLSDDAGNYISKSTDSAEIETTFNLRRDSVDYRITYNFVIKRHIGDTAVVQKEKITYKKYLEEAWTRKSVLIDYDYFSENYTFLPKENLSQIISADPEAEIDLAVAKKITFKEMRSFVFSEDIFEIINRNPKADLFRGEFFLLKELSQYAKRYFFVLHNDRNAAIGLGLFLPFAFNCQINANSYVSGELAVKLSGPSEIPLRSFEIVKPVVESINVVINKVIPGLQLAVQTYSEQLNQEGNPTVRIELVSVRGETRIPLRYESEGIKKIISVINVLVAMYNNGGIFVAIDELDAGIFEFLLGEILGMLQDSGKGQLLFTSHDLRPLEMLDPSSLVFSTSNPNNRYIRLSGVKKNNNMRDLYIRTINIGGQDEIVYEPTSEDAMSRAFRKVGRKINE